MKSKITPIQIDICDLSAALREGAPADDEGETAREISARVGHGEKWVREALRKLHVAGKLELGRRTIEYIDGRRGQTPVYRIRQ